MRLYGCRTRFRSGSTRPQSVRDNEFVVIFFETIASQSKLDSKIVSFGETAVAIQEQLYSEDRCPATLILKKIKS